VHCSHNFISNQIFGAFRHNEALNHAVMGVKIAHFLIKDFYNLCKASKAKIERLKHDPTETATLLERTAVKLMPIVQEIVNRMVPEKTLDGLMNGSSSSAAFAREGSANMSFEGKSLNNTDSNFFDLNNLKKNKYDQNQFDMRNVLGYLNQNEWLWALNIGNIM
jgi:hypothetical protein